MLWCSLDRVGSLGENGYMHMCGQVPAQFTWNITTLLIGYTPIQNKKLKNVSLSVKSFLKHFIDNMKMKTSQNNFNLNISSIKLRRRQWQPTLVLLPGKSHGRSTLVGCSPWCPKSQTRLSDFTFTFHFHALEKEMATHSSVLALGPPSPIPRNLVCEGGPCASY